MATTKVGQGSIEGLVPLIDSRIEASQAATQDLIPVDDTKSLGTAAKSWSSLSTKLVKFYNAAGTFYTGLKAGALAATAEFTLPTADGESGHLLTTDGDGNLYFAEPPVTGTANKKLITSGVWFVGAGGVGSVVASDTTVTGGGAPSGTLLARKFTLNESVNIASVELSLRAYNPATGLFNVQIVSDASGTPDETSVLATSGNVDASTIINTFTFVPFTITASLAAGTYWIIFAPPANIAIQVSSAVSSGKYSNDGGVTWIDDSLSTVLYKVYSIGTSGLNLTADAFIQTAGLPDTANKVAPFSRLLADGQVLYVVLNSTAAPATLTVVTDIASAVENTPDRFIIARRKGDNYFVSDDLLQSPPDLSNYLSKVDTDQLASGLFTFTDETNSYDPSQGAVKISGGLGITKSLSVGESIAVTGNLTVTGVAEFADQVSSQGNINTIGDMAADGGMYANEIYAYIDIISEGTGQFGGVVNMTNHKIVNLAAPELSTDAVNMQYVQNQIASLPPAGAQTNLNNLTTTSVNLDLNPQTSNDQALGRYNQFWSRIFGGLIGAKTFIIKSDDFLDNIGAVREGGDYYNGSLVFPAVNVEAIRTGTNPEVSLKTANTTGAIRSGDTWIATGNNEATGDTGNVNITTGVPVSGARGVVSILGTSLKLNGNKITNLATPTDATDAANKQFVTDQIAAIPAPVSSGADRNLSNLLATSINQDLRPNEDVGFNLGSPSFRWGNIYALGIAYLGKVSLVDASNILKGNLLSRAKTVDGTSYTGIEVAAGASVYKDVAMSTNSDGAADGVATGSIVAFTGDKIDGTGNSGEIKLYTGTSFGGIRGKINLSGSSVDVNNSKITNLATPTANTDGVNKLYADTRPFSVAQIVHVQNGASSSTSSTIQASTSGIPQNTEGAEFMSLTITPKSATSKLFIEAVVHGYLNTDGNMTTALFQDSIAGAKATATCFWVAGFSGASPMFLRFEVTSGTTAATTFKIRAGGNAGTFTFNGLHGGILASNMRITETYT